MALDQRIALWIERRQWRIVRRFVRAILDRFEFDRLIDLIAEEQRRRYYEDNFYTRRAQFMDAIEKAVKP